MQPGEETGVCSESLGLFLCGSLCGAVCGVRKDWAARRLRGQGRETRFMLDMSLCT